MTPGTGGGAHTFFQLLPGGIRLGFLVAAGYIVQDALEGLLQNTHAVATVVGHPQFFTAGTIKNHVHGLSGKLLYRNG